MLQQCNVVKLRRAYAWNCCIAYRNTQSANWCENGFPHFNTPCSHEVCLQNGCVVLHSVQWRYCHSYCRASGCLRWKLYVVNNNVMRSVARTCRHLGAAPSSINAYTAYSRTPTVLGRTCWRRLIQPILPRCLECRSAGGSVAPTATTTWKNLSRGTECMLQTVEISCCDLSTSKLVQRYVMLHEDHHHW